MDIAKKRRRIDDSQDADSKRSVNDDKAQFHNGSTITDFFQVVHRKTLTSTPPKVSQYAAPHTPMLKSADCSKISELSQRLTTIQSDYALKEKSFQDQISALNSHMIASITNLSANEREQMRARVQEECRRIGNLVYYKRAFHWNGGWEPAEQAELERQITVDESDIIRLKKQLASATAQANREEKVKISQMMMVQNTNSNSHSNPVSSSHHTASVPSIGHNNNNQTTSTTTINGNVMVFNDTKTTSSASISSPYGTFLNVNAFMKPFHLNTASSTKTTTITSSSIASHDSQQQIQSNIPTAAINETQLLREVIAAKTLSLAKTRFELDDRRSRLERDRNVLKKNLRVLEAQDASTLRDFRILNDRYQILNMLGCGGFGEVWSAWDIERQLKVAIKIHRLQSDWSISQQQAYVKHALREVDIHQKLVHPRVVKCYERFLIDEQAFGTALEYIAGQDLDVQLKQLGFFLEKEAKSICHQLLSGLRYMASCDVIHYDLKPGNIMYLSGEVKITDFGLSKLLPQGDEDLALTSQGAGTSWYLPPETFQNDPRISPLVDVWSVGVIYYELLFGRKPFGDGASQDVLTRMRISCKEIPLEFPSTPQKISEGAKEFIMFLLETDPSKRPSASEAYDHPYFSMGKPCFKDEDESFIAGEVGNKKDNLSNNTPKKNTTITTNSRRKQPAGAPIKISKSSAATPNSRHQQVNNGNVESDVEANNQKDDDGIIQEINLNIETKQILEIIDEGNENEENDDKHEMEKVDKRKRNSGNMKLKTRLDSQNFEDENDDPISHAVRNALRDHRLEIKSRLGELVEDDDLL